MADHTSTSSSEDVISLECFLEKVRNPGCLGKELTDEQEKVIRAGPNESLFIVAGPGSGKTSVIVLRILKLILVDGVDPETILATTFTRKAARELKSRILEWGKKISDEIHKEEAKREKFWSRLTKVRTGTIDSIIQEALSRFLKPGESLPTLIDDLTAVNLMRRVIYGIIYERRSERRKVISDVTHEGDKVNFLLREADFFKTRRERLYQDRFIKKDFNDEEHRKKIAEDIERHIESRYKTTYNKNKNAIEETFGKHFEKVFQHYDETLESKRLMDFILLEEFFRMILYNEASDINDCFKKILNRHVCGSKNDSQNGEERDSKPGESQSSSKGGNEQNSEEKNSTDHLPEYIRKLKVIFVDEYQDTNSLQERIYFKLAEFAIGNGGSITVVGDDDQSIYRFRGSSVELFMSFEERLKSILSKILSKHVNVKRVDLNTNFRSTECIVRFCEYFANSYEEYKQKRLKKSNSMKPSEEKCENSQIEGSCDVQIITEDDEKELAKKLYEGVIQKEIENGNKWVLLCHSAREQWQENQKRLPGHLRDCLKENEKSVFNPRGAPISSVEEIRILCAAILLYIIDEKGILIKEIKEDKKTKEEGPKSKTDLIIQVIEKIERWKEDDIDKDDGCLSQIREVANKIKEDSEGEELTLIQLIYTLVSKVDKLRSLLEDTEKAAYLEAILRVISGFKLIDQDDVSLSNPSKERVKKFIYNIFAPIVLDDVQLDEELLEMVPDKDFQIMTIHQSKGLEFDNVIVYVEMDKKSKPKDVEEIADLIRLYYVAFSRAKKKLVIACDCAEQQQGELFQSQTDPSKTIQSCLTEAKERLSQHCPHCPEK